MTLAADLPADLPRALPADRLHSPGGKASPTDSGAELVLWMVPTLLLALVLAVKTWGFVALTMAALPLVPVMFVIFIWITLP
jgi:hypothetical protein